MVGIATHCSLTSPIVNPPPLGKFGEAYQEWYLGYKYKQTTGSMIAFQSRFPGRKMPVDENGFIDLNEVNRILDAFLIQKVNDFNEEIRENTKIANYFLPVTFESKHRDYFHH
jgi:hypothetical protein